jgi:hypothetical protein
MCIFLSFFCFSSPRGPGPAQFPEAWVLVPLYHGIKVSQILLVWNPCPEGLHQLSVVWCISHATPVSLELEITQGKVQTRSDFMKPFWILLQLFCSARQLCSLYRNF